MNRTALVWFGRALLALACIVLWQLANRGYGDMAVASLPPVLARIAQIATNGSLLANLAVTGAEAGLGILYGAAVGIVLPVVLARFHGSNAPSILFWQPRWGCRNSLLLR